MRFLKSFKIFESTLNMQFNVEEILNSYLYTALWTEELDTKYDVSDFDINTKENSKTDIELFINKAKEYLIGLDNNTIGHNFWLTRNHHGAGFWDLKDLDKETGKKISEICHEFKEVNLFENEGSLIIE